MGNDWYWVAEVISRAIGVVFAYSAYAKLRTFGAFARGLRGYRILTEALLLPAAVLLISAELAVAALHLAVWEIRYAAPVTIMLLVGLLGVTVSSLRSGQTPRRCLCFGADGEEYVDATTVVRLGLLLGAEIVLLLFFLYGTFDAGKISEGESIVLSVLTASIAVMLVNWGLAIPMIIIWWRWRPTRRWRFDNA